MGIAKSVLVASALVCAVALPGHAQQSRWNDRAAADTLGDAPAVRISIEGRNSFSYGEPVRVRFQVDHDAYVVVGRVDGNGHVTVLFPNSRNGTQQVRGGEDRLIRSRTSGSYASFYATDREGGGYVFAIASYAAFDLSNLGARDFDRYVTGMYVGRPSRTYIGDPYRVITRFATAVSVVEGVPIDYDIAYYDVAGPRYVTSVGYSAYCGGPGYSSAAFGRYVPLAERWDDAMYYGDSYGAAFGSCLPRSCSALNSYYYFAGYGFVPFCGGYTQTTATNTPPGTIPTTPTEPGSVPGPLVDSIAGSRPNPPIANPPVAPPLPPGDRRPIDRPRIASERDANKEGFVYAGSRRIPGDVYDGDGKSFSIPERALTNIRRREPAGEIAGPRELPNRGGTRQAGDGEQIQWVRPPVEVIRGGARGDDASLPRTFRRDGGRSEGSPDRGVDRAGFLPTGRGDGERFNAPTRNDAPERFAPPSRVDRPRFVDSPSINSGAGIRNSDGGNFRSPEPMRADPPRVNIDRPSPPPSPPPAPATKEPAAADKKPN